MQELFIFRY